MMTGNASPMGSPTVRRAERGDATAIRTLLSQVGPQSAPEREVFDAAYTEVLTQHDDHLLFVVDLDGAVVGYALATIARLFFTNGDSAQIHELVVDEAVRGRGIGGQLVSAVERECLDRGVKQLTVSTLKNAEFYERLDYRSTADFLKKKFDE